MFFNLKSSTTSFFRKVFDVVHNIKVGIGAVCTLIASGGIRLVFKMRNTYVFECWRRPAGCECTGCANYFAAQSLRENGTLQPEEEYLFADTTCRHQYLAWRESVLNLVFDAGINDLLTQYFKGAAYTAGWFVGLVDGGSAPTYAAGDTSASHAGWTENTSYSQATRPALTLGSVASKSVDNSASKAVFGINATVTIAGAFITTLNTKSGTTGITYGAANFGTGNRSAINGDTLNVTATLTGS